MSHRPISLGALLVFYGLLAGTSDPARKLSEIFSRVQRAAAASDRVFALLDREPTISDPPNPRPLPRHCRSIRLEGVAFRYNPNVPVLEDIDLEIPAGETLAIVGHNGCGKSTLANLLPRFYDPQEGKVLWDGVDVRDVKIRDLRTQIGIVTQETLLFDDTVMNNIRYGSPGATSEAVIAAAKQAHAHDFILERLEHGYESSVGPRGGLLSGGQRQRIALARAILRDPALLILDEATSQVDLESEQLIQQVLEEFTRNRTTVIITHRLSTLALADRILVMESGRISDLGTHRELLGRCELYRRLHDIGFKAADEMRDAA
jgi:ATP-binding cassette subfamily B protein/subfamily B ATP-binding cassette protein MsbA